MPTIIHVVRSIPKDQTSEYEGRTITLSEDQCAKNITLNRVNYLCSDFDNKTSLDQLFPALNKLINPIQQNKNIIIINTAAVKDGPATINTLCRNFLTDLKTKITVKFMTAPADEKKLTFFNMDVVLSIYINIFTTVFETCFQSLEAELKKDTNKTSPVSLVHIKKFLSSLLSEVDTAVIPSITSKDVEFYNNIVLKHIIKEAIFEYDFSELLKNYWGILLNEKICLFLKNYKRKKLIFISTVYVNTPLRNVVLSKVDKQYILSLGTIINNPSSTDTKPELLNILINKDKINKIINGTLNDMSIYTTIQHNHIILKPDLLSSHSERDNLLKKAETPEPTYNLPKFLNEPYIYAYLKIEIENYIASKLETSEYHIIRLPGIYTIENCKELTETSPGTVINSFLTTLCNYQISKMTPPTSFTQLKLDNLQIRFPINTTIISKFIIDVFINPTPYNNIINFRGFKPMTKYSLCQELFERLKTQKPLIQYTKNSSTTSLDKSILDVDFSELVEELNPNFVQFNQVPFTELMILDERVSQFIKDTSNDSTDSKLIDDMVFKHEPILKLISNPILLIENIY